MIVKTYVDSQRCTRVIGEEVGIVVRAFDYISQAVDFIRSGSQAVQCELAILVGCCHTRLIDRTIWRVLGNCCHDRPR